MIRPRTAAARAALGAALLLAAAGCGKDRDVLIRVGTRTVTVDEFKSVARGNESQYLGSPDQAKAQLFDDLLRRALLLREAEQRGFYRDSAVAAARRDNEEKVLTEALFVQLTPANVRVSDAEVARAIAWRDTSTHMLAIYTPSRAMAYAALAQIRGGTDFSEVADHFNTPGLLPAGGDLGFLTPGALISPLDRVLRTGPVGEVVGPLEGPGEGWFVLKVVAREYRPQPSADTQAPLVREMLRQRKRRIASLDAYAALKAEYRYRRLPGAGQALFARFQSPLAGQIGGMGGTTLPPTPTALDATHALAVWDGPSGHAAFTLSDALDALESSGQSPDAQSVAALEYWIDQQAMRRVALAEARRRLLDQDPETRRKLDGAVDNRVLQAIYDQDVVPEAELIPSDPRAFYATIQDNFQRLEEATLERATIADSALANQVLIHGGHAPDLTRALAMVSSDAPVTTITMSFPSKDPEWQGLQATLMQLPPGQYLGPYRNPAGWHVLRIVSKRQRPATYDELEPALRQMVDRQSEERRRDAALRKVTDHLMRQYKPELFPDRLRSIPWPIEGPATTG